MSSLIKRLYAPFSTNDVLKILDLELDITLLNGQTFHGRIVKVTNDSLVFKNLMRNKSVIQFQEIQEINWTVC
ncbi:hypothetical protein OAH12_01975 [Cyclobacteriaceae bacterium]|nr:hypothetical protein [Cyclobacteriaceae bacterium]